MDVALINIVPLVVAILVFTVVFLVFSVIWTQRAHKARIADMASYAAKREWRYTLDGSGLASRFVGQPFGRGSGRRTTHVVEGWYDGWAFVAFDYKYESSSGDSSTTHRHAVVSMHLGELAQPVPMVEIEPQGAVGRFFSDLLDLGHRTGDPAFDAAYRVRTDSPDLAHDLLHHDLRLFLMSFRDRAWRWEGDSLLMIRRGTHSPAEIDEALASTKAVLDRVPPVVWDRLRGGEQAR